MKLPLFLLALLLSLGPSLANLKPGFAEVNGKGCVSLLIIHGLLSLLRCSCALFSIRNFVPFDHQTLCIPDYVMNPTNSPFP